MSEIRPALRHLLKHPGFTGAAVLTLMLGLGVNLVLFTTLYDQFLRPRNLVRPEEVWAIVPSDASGAPKAFNLSAPYFDAIRDGNTAFERVIQMRGQTGRLAVGDGWQRSRWHFVSWDYFQFLGIQPVLGRGFFRDEDQGGDAPPVAVISHRLWQERFGGDPQALGKTLVLKGEYPASVTAQIVGIMPPGFEGLGSSTVDVWMPAAMQGLFTVPSTGWVFGRLRPGMSPGVAAASLDPLVGAVTQTIHGSPQPPSVAGNNAQFTRVALLRAGYGTQHRAFGMASLPEFLKTHALAAGANLLVLVIALFNLGNLLLAHGHARQRELAIRLSLGATRGTLIRSSLIEGVVLAGMGCAGALALMSLAGSLLPGILSAVVPEGGAAVNFRVDLRIAGFAMALAVVSGAGASLLPALRVTRLDPVAGLRGFSSHAADPHHAWRRFLVISQVGGTLVLMAGVFLCLRTVQSQLRQDPGYPLSHRLLVTVPLEEAIRSRFQPGEGEFRPQYMAYVGETAPRRCEELRQELAGLPGVLDAGVLGQAPFDGRGREVVTTRLDGHAGVEQRFAARWAGPDGFSALGIPLALGRDVSPGDLTTHRRVALVNERFANAFWPGRNPVGLQIYDETWNEPHEVIGVVRDARLDSPAEPPAPTAFFAGVPTCLNPTFVLRTDPAAGALIPSVRAALTRADPWLLESRISTLEQQVAVPLAAQRAVTFRMGVTAVLALLLAMLGIHSVVILTVHRRLPEFAVRIALGAPRRDIAQRVLASGLSLVLAGIGLGLPFAAASVVVLRHFIPGLAPFDGVALVLGGAALAAGALVACGMPTYRAARVPPAILLRSE